MNFPSTPPRNWAREVPRYKATRDLQPASKPRFRLEPPFAVMYSENEWQFGEKFIPAGTEFSSQAWPHPTLCPLNYSAAKVLDYFNTRQRSRMPLSPWRNGKIDLDDGLTGPVAPNILMNSGVTAA